MKIKYFTFILLITFSTACKPLESLFSKNNQSTNKETETSTSTSAEEALILQARIAAKEQAERRAEMTRQRKARLDTINIVQEGMGMSRISIDELEKLQEEEKAANRKAAIEAANKEVVAALEAEKNKAEANKVTIGDRINNFKKERAAKVAANKEADRLEAERLAKAEIVLNVEPEVVDTENVQIVIPQQENSLSTVEDTTLIAAVEDEKTNQNRKGVLSFLKKNKNKQEVTVDNSSNIDEGSKVDDNTPISLDIIEEDVDLDKVQDIPAPTLKPFYFPVDELETAKAYCYVPDDGSSDTTYWLMKTISFGGKSFLITEKYDHNFTMLSSSRERLNEIGAYLESYTAYENSGLGGSQAVEYWIEDNEAFRWNMADGRFAMVTMNYNSNEFLNYDITSYRERYFRNKGDSFIFQDRVVETIVFEDKLVTVYVDNKNNEDSYPSSHEHHFALGIGLVKYTIFNQGDGFSVARTYTLDSILDYKTWQTLSQKK